MKNLLLTTAMVAGLYGSANASFLYNVDTLGMSGQSLSSAKGLNDFGQATVNLQIGGGPRAYIGSVNGLTPLGIPVSGSYTDGAGINNLGDVVGDVDGRAFLWQNGGSMTDLGTLGGSTSYATSVNDAGVVVGQSYTDQADTVHAFLWSNGSMSDLGTLGGRDSTAQDINKASQVAGFAYTGSAFHGFLWTAGSMQDLGSLDGGDSYAYGLNDAGHVVGWSSVGVSGHNHAFIWTPTIGMVNLGTLGGSASFALDINNFGQVVGTSINTDDQQRAFIWTDLLGMVDLNSLIDPASGWTIVGAEKINEVGQILAIGYSPTGSYEAVLLAPVPVPVPEPATYALVLSGLGLLGLAKARSRHTKAATKA